MFLPDWPRPEYRPGGGDALLYYQLFGESAASLAIDGREYRCGGVPPGVALDEYERERQPAAFDILNEPYFSPMLDELGVELETRVRAAQQCLIVHGAVLDPPNLNYLRDTVGIVQYLLDHGFTAVLDLQALTWYTPEQWRSRLFDPTGPVPRHHAIVMGSEDEGRPYRLWYHTRGMRKFGRPDVSVRNVPPELAAVAESLCGRFIEHLAFGMLPEEGREIVMPGVPAGVRCHHAGDLDDPDFNNVHIEIRFPD